MKTPGGPSARERLFVEKIEFILSSDRVAEWNMLRESMQDGTLRSADGHLYVSNMRAAYLQLLGGALGQAMGGPSAMMRDPMPFLLARIEMGNLIKARLQGDEEILQLSRAYNSAYGSSSTNGIGAMSEEFGRRVINGRLPQGVAVAMTEHFTGAWRQLIRELERADAQASIRKAGEPPGVG